MDIADFYNKAVGSLPVIRQKADFRKDLENSLSKYLENVKAIDEHYFAGNQERLEVIDQIDEQSKWISEVVDLYYAGQHADAFKKFQQQFNAPDGILNNIGTHTVTVCTTEQYRDNAGELQAREVPTVWFRARIFENKQEHTFNEMFHIPLNSREIVNTQRYSAPGYPCLYLGNTIYSCWEEMHRPRFDDVMFSGFKVRHDFNVYDLRIPNRSDFEGSGLTRSLRRMPLIIACMIRVKNYDRPFKPEYIIPQLLIDTIICNNRKDRKDKCGPLNMTWGIIYTSTHISRDFPYGVEYLENMALPVIESDDAMNYCRVLASLFAISDPLCYEYEALKENNAHVYWESITVTQEERLRKQYQESKMGYLETRIKGNSEFQVLPHFIVNVSNEGITIPQNGSSVSVEVRSSEPLEIIDGHYTLKADMQ